VVYLVGIASALTTAIVFVFLAAIMGRKVLAEENQEQGQESEPLWLNRVMTRRLLIHTNDNRTFDGSLSEVTQDGLILKAATLKANGQDVRLAGEVFVPRSCVSFTQLSD
jgi:hypothetical protein